MCRPGHFGRTPSNSVSKPALETCPSPREQRREQGAVCRRFACWLGSTNLVCGVISGLSSQGAVGLWRVRLLLGFDDGAVRQDHQGRCICSNCRSACDYSLATGLDFIEHVARSPIFCQNVFKRISYSVISIGSSFTISISSPPIVVKKMSCAFFVVQLFHGCRMPWFVVKVSRRLIRENDARPGSQRAGNSHALALAAA